MTFWANSKIIKAHVPLGEISGYTKDELLKTTEFNSGVYAFDYKKLVELINNISSNNAQNEIYITDLIELFNQKGYSVGAVSPKEQYVVMGFNDKSVLKEMDEIARRNVYEKLNFVLDREYGPDYSYVKNNKRLSKQNCKKKNIQPMPI
jgi:dTDP-glucose pyrophosphorylase